MLNRINALNAPDPAVNFRWFVTVPDGGQGYDYVAERITATFPKVPAKARFTHGRQNYYPDNNDIDGITIAFYETYDFRVTKWLSRWRGRIVHPDGTYGVPRDYQRDIIADLYLIGSNAPVLTLTYKKCWPTDQGAFDLSYEDETGRIIVEVQFATNQVDQS